VSADRNRSSSVRNGAIPELAGLRYVVWCAIGSVNVVLMARGCSALSRLVLDQGAVDPRQLLLLKAGAADRPELMEEPHPALLL
jgi:hypothetical protein